MVAAVADYSDRQEELLVAEALGKMCSILVNRPLLWRQKRQPRLWPSSAPRAAASRLASAASFSASRAPARSARRWSLSRACFPMP